MIAGRVLKRFSRWLDLVQRIRRIEHERRELLDLVRIIYVWTDYKATPWAIRARQALEKGGSL